MDTLLAIVGYGIIVVLVLAFCVWLLVLILWMLPITVAGLLILLPLGLPVWAWHEYGWPAAIAAVFALVAARDEWKLLMAAAEAWVDATWRIGSKP